MGINQQLVSLVYNCRTREVSTHPGCAPCLLSKQCGALLQQFLKAPDNTLTRDEIRTCLWGHSFVSEDTINHAVCRLRKSLAKMSEGQCVYIETLPATGYRLHTGDTHLPHNISLKFRRSAVLIASMLSLL